MKSVRSTQDATAITDALELRSVTWLATLPTSSLEALAEQLQSVRGGAGTVLQRDDEPTDQVFLVREGAVKVFAGDRQHVATATLPVSLLHLLAGRTDGIRAVAETNVRAFTIQSDAVWESLEEDFVALVHSVVQLARALIELRHRPRPEPLSPLVDFDNLTSRILWLRSTCALREAPVREVAVLARRASVRDLEPGDVLWEAGDAVPGMCFILCGELEEGAHRAGPGALLGELCALCEQPAGSRCLAAAASRVLWLDADTIWDVFEDHFPLVRHALARLANATLWHTARPDVDRRRAPTYGPAAR